MNTNSRVRSSKTHWLWLVPFAVSAVTAAACGRAGAAAAAPASANDVAGAARDVRTITVAPAAILDYLELAAHIEADPTDVVHVYPQMAGRITRMAVHTWDHVEQGQTLAWLPERRSGPRGRRLSESQR